VEVPVKIFVLTSLMTIQNLATTRADVGAPMTFRPRLLR